MNASTTLTTKLMKAFSDRIGTAPTGFLSSFFGKNKNEIYTFDSESVEIDIEREGEKIAIDVVRGGSGNLNTYGKYTTKIYVPPLYNEYSNLSARQLTKRLPGQQTNAPVNKNANQSFIILTSQFENVKKIMRAMEYQASKALFTGQIPFVNADTLDFKRKATHNITPAKLWTDTTDADPLADLAAACIANRKDGKVQTDIAIFGTEAWDAFKVHPKVTEALGNRRIVLGEIKPKFAKQGAVYQTTIWAGGYQLECYTYDEYYEDAAGDLQPYVPTNQVICMYSGARLNKCFGSVDILPHAKPSNNIFGINIPVPTIGSIVPYAYNNKESNVIVGVKSAPLLVPTQIDAICNINAVA